jgi:hypothetical protein
MSNLLLGCVLLLNAALLAAFVIVAGRLRARFQRLDQQFEGINHQVQAEFRNRLFPKLEESIREIQHASAIGHMNFRMPLFLGGWSIDAFLGRRLIQHLIDERPRSILELGAGSSTVLIARCLQLLQYRAENHVAVDHHGRYLEATRRALAVNGLGEGVNLLLCPLSSYSQFSKLWYGNLAERLEGMQFELLLIDGPPGDMQEQSRYPALPLLSPYLAPRCTIILDDASRADEQEIVRKWQYQFPEFSVEFISDGHGFAILRRG